MNCKMFSLRPSKKTPKRKQGEYSWTSRRENPQTSHFTVNHQPRCSQSAHSLTSALRPARSEGHPQTWQHLTINLKWTYPLISLWHTNTTLADACRVRPVIQTSLWLYGGGVHGWPGKLGSTRPSERIRHNFDPFRRWMCQRRVKKNVSAPGGLLHFDMLWVHELFSRLEFMWVGGCACVRACSGPSSPLSGLGCDGWAAEDPGIQASACSSSAQSSEESDIGTKKTSDLCGSWVSI